VCIQAPPPVAKAAARGGIPVSPSGTHAPFPPYPSAPVSCRQACVYSSTTHTHIHTYIHTYIHTLYLCKGIPSHHAKRIPKIDPKNRYLSYYYTEISYHLDPAKHTGAATVRSTYYLARGACIQTRPTPAISEGCTRSLRISHSMYCIVPTSCDLIT
jgi:hypothetical protein